MAAKQTDRQVRGVRTKSDRQTTRETDRQTNQTERDRQTDQTHRPNRQTEASSDAEQAQ